MQKSMDESTALTLSRRKPLLPWLKLRNLTPLEGGAQCRIVGLQLGLFYQECLSVALIGTSLTVFC
jgi:hypothetical protein